MEKLTFLLAYLEAMAQFDLGMIDVTAMNEASRKFLKDKAQADGSLAGHEEVLAEEPAPEPETLAEAAPEPLPEPETLAEAAPEPTAEPTAEATAEATAEVPEPLPEPETLAEAAPEPVA